MGSFKISSFLKCFFFLSGPNAILSQEYFLIKDPHPGEENRLSKKKKRKKMVKTLANVYGKYGIFLPSNNENVSNYN